MNDFLLNDSLFSSQRSTNRGHMFIEVPGWVYLALTDAWLQRWGGPTRQDFAMSWAPASESSASHSLEVESIRESQPAARTPQLRPNMDHRRAWTRKGAGQIH